MASYFQKNRHDLSITDPSTADVIGFNVMRDPKTGAPMFSEYDGKALVDLFSSAAPTQLSTDPERLLVLGQSTHHAGFGVEYYDSGDTKRYFNSHGMDLSNENNGILSWGATAIVLTTNTISAAATLTNADMELAANWTNGSRSSGQAHGGTYSWSVPVATTAYQDAATWGTSWQSKPFTFGCWVYGTAASRVRISLNDGVDTTTSSFHTGVAGWEFLSVQRTLDASATRLRCQLESGVDAGQQAFFDDAILGSPVAGITPVHATFNDAEYIAIGQLLAKLNGTGDGFTGVASLPAAISSLTPFQVSGTDYLFIFLGTSNDYWYMTTGEVVTKSTATNKTYQFATWVNTTVDTLYANDGVNTIRSTTNPLNGGTAWSAQTVVGAAADVITHLQEKSGALLIDKEDMPYYLDSSGDVQKDLAPECASGKAAHSGKNSTMYQGIYYRPTGDQALLSSGTTNEWIQPAKFTNNNSDFAGQCEAVAGDEEWLYLVTDNSTKIEVLKGRSETIDGTTAWRWHTYQEITLSGVETMWISTVFQKRLWISSTTATESLQYIPLPTKYASLTSDGNRNFSTGGTFETPWLHGGFPNDNKLAQSLDVTMGHAYDADIYFTVKYKELGDSSWTSIGNYTGSATTMTQTRYISTSSSSIVSPMYQLQFTGVTDDTEKTPVLLNYKLNTVLQSIPNRIIMTRVKVSKEQADGIGMIGRSNFELQKTCLANMKATSNLITMIEYITDKDGVTRYYKLLPLPGNIPWCEPYNDSLQGEQRKDAELVYNLALLNVPLS